LVRKIDIEKERQIQQKWAEYRKWTVTEIVRDVYRRAKALKPRAQVTAAVFRNRQAADAVYQDWYAWLKEGIIDYVLPMDYTTDIEILRRDLQEWKEADPGLKRIIPGLGIFLSPDNPQLFLEQRKLCIDAGAKGVVYFWFPTIDENWINAFREVHPEKTAPYRPGP